MDVRTQFGLAVQRLRRKSGFSQEDLSGLTEIDRAYVGRLERGEANPTLLMLVRIASAFEVSLSELLRDVKFIASLPNPPAPGPAKRRLRRH
ncbi:MAG TPA: helix-turn-helix transcriptional regulator [Magnetospirillaceae bacterium]|jgi:transcriptional regulator with XRE-family HTH domain